MTAALLSPATPQMWWCPDCEIYCHSHPLDHLDEAHPPQFTDGSRSLPERMTFMGIS